jgi:hypothetical protein
MYMDAAANLNPAIGLYEVAGNHDVSAAPTPAKYTWYESHFGDLWYTFTYGNNLFIGLESCILIDSSGYPGKDTEQMDWLTTTLANASGYDNILVFMHHPLCVNSVDEPDSWVNIPPARRAELLSLFHQYGVRAVFAGHYHQNAYVNDGGLEIITTSSCTCPLASDPPGFRIIDVYSDHIEQAYYDLDDITGQATNPSPADGATDVSINADLSWTAGSGADSPSALIRHPMPVSSRATRPVRLLTPARWPPARPTTGALTRLTPAAQPPVLSGASQPKQPRRRPDRRAIRALLMGQPM